MTEETITAADVGDAAAVVEPPKPKVFAEIKAELKVLIAKAKKAWDEGEQELHDIFHARAKAKAAEAGAAISVSGKADGVLIAHDPTPEPQESGSKAE